MAKVCKSLWLPVVAMLCLGNIAVGQLQVHKLTVDGCTAPLGVSAHPAFSWQLQSAQRGILQTAYRIIVADNLQSIDSNTGNVWDTKRVASGNAVLLPYKGAGLQPARVYYWKVMVWDNQQRASAWSNAATWQTGLFTMDHWQGARWISNAVMPDSLLNVLPVDGKKDTYKGHNDLPLLRKTFVVKSRVKRATAFISGVGHFEMSINGTKVGDHFLDPGWTKYDQQALYVTFDVTTALKKGGNAIGVMLGNGFYYVPPVPGRFRKLKSAFGYPKMICRLLIEYADGSHQNIISNQSWKTGQSPITFSSIYGGEDYDATREQPGWNKYGFNDARWKTALVVSGPPVLDAQMAAPVKVMDTLRAIAVNLSKTGNWVYDLGQNASGIPLLKVKGNKGDTLRIYPGELLNADGNVTQKHSGGPYYLQYILKGDGIETWQPRFTYYGYRYLQVQGATPTGKEAEKKLPELLALTGLHIRNAAPTIGAFSCSNTLFNQTFTLVDWAIKSNMVSVFTDCPHREKLGWLEQTHLMGNSVMYNYQTLQLFKKQLADMRYSQTADGLIPEIAPEFVKFEWGGDMFRDSPEWGSSGIILPWYLYQWYGDASVLSENYDMMKRYIAYLGKKAEGHLLKQGLGDWYDLGPKAPGVSQLTPMGVTGTAIYYYDLQILQQVAGLLNKHADALKYGVLAAKVKQAFNDGFFNRQTMQYATGSQTANAMAVYMQLVEPQYKQQVIDNLVADIRSRGNALTTGDIGYRYLLRVLHQQGRSDVIFDMNSRSDVPGYGYQLAKGATALTESWSALPTNSNNHFMLGHIMEWFYRGVAGINQADTSVAFKTVVIKPEMVGDLTWAKASFESMYGTIASGWQKTEEGLELRVHIPANTTAMVFVPAAWNANVCEGNVPLARAGGITIAGREGEYMKVQIGSGSYHFTVKN